MNILLIIGFWAATTSPWAMPEEEVLAWQTTMSQGNGELAAQQYAAEIAEAELLGRKIYQHDQAAARGTDFVLKKTNNNIRSDARGWIEQPLEGGGFRIFFFGELSSDEYFPIYAVDVVNGEVRPSSYREYAEQTAFEPSLNNLARARMEALRQPFQACSASYNTVVFETEDKSDDYYVYLLAGTSDPAEVRLGGNYRFKVDFSDGGVTGFQKFANSCITLRKDHSSDSKVIGVAVTHLLTPYPNEIHVFMSLLHNLDMYVLTIENKISWKVSAGKISARDKAH